MKIIHLSDLHIGYAKGRWDCGKRAEAIVDAVIGRCQPATDYVVVITGDIVDKGKKHEQFKQAADIIGAFKEKSIECIVVPGNHDYGSGLGIAKRHQSAFKKMFYGAKDEPFPRLKVVRDTAFISLDSLQGEFDLSGNVLEGDMDRTGGADGCIGPKQLKEFRKLFGRPDVIGCRYRVVLLHHHPLYKAGGFLELKDADDFTASLEELDVDMVLFGHKHGGDELTNHWGVPRVYDGGSSTGKNMEIPTKIRVIDLGKPPGQYATVAWDIPEIGGFRGNVA